MTIDEPLVFEPLFMERVWGGRRLETRYGKRLPGGARIGESWEIVDREEAQSVVHNGPLRGKTLHELWTDHREVIFGAGTPTSERFPLLVKLLDAQERLSVQVHPPARIAVELHGEPKTEMWFITDTQADSDIFAGLKSGATRDSLDHALQDGSVAAQLHRIPVKPGDSIFIPSGRLHAIGAGNLIVEIQQNSDTTYRVFDWNRVGLDGKPRELHIRESLASIDFEDVEPELILPEGELLVQCPEFRVEKWALSADRSPLDASGTFAIFACLSGTVECGGKTFNPGDFFLVPPSMSEPMLKATAPGTEVLRATLPPRPGDSPP